MAAELRENKKNNCIIRSSNYQLSEDPEEPPLSIKKIDQPAMEPGGPQPMQEVQQQEQHQQQQQQQQQQEQQQQHQQRNWIVLPILVVVLAVLLLRWRWDSNLPCEELTDYRSLWDLKYELSRRVHGQHIATELLGNLVSGHYRTEPQKPLVVSLNGLTGTGKTFVANIFGSALFQNEEARKRQFQYVSGPGKFSQVNVRECQEQLRQWVEDRLNTCKKMVIVIDEVDNMAEGCLNILKPIVDHQNREKAKSSVFFFLSNTGGTDIAQKTFQYLEGGNPRKNLERRAIAHKLPEEMKKEGGLKDSSLIESGLIDAFIPFLPLEESHAKLCITDDLESKGFTLPGGKKGDDILEEIYKELEKKVVGSISYPTYGCKKIDRAVDNYLEGINFYRPLKQHKSTKV